MRELLYKLADALASRLAWDIAVSFGVGYTVARATGDTSLGVLCGSLAFLITVRFPSDE